MRLYVFLCLALCFSSVVGHGKHLICKEVDDVFSESSSIPSQSLFHQGRPGKRGSPGTKGEIGDIGPPGPSAVVNYTLIQDTVNERISFDNELMFERIRTLEGVVQNLSQLYANLPKQVTTAHCDVFYIGRCFRFIRKTPNANFAAAEILCQEIGWKLANIYGPVHYEMIADYLRRNIEPSGRYIIAWLGMTINPSNKVMSYLNGTTASSAGLKWYPGYPSSDPSFTKMGIHINRDKGSIGQGIHSYPAHGTRHGSICEN